MVASYFKLVRAFGKKAHFVYDLDAVFSGPLRRNANSDDAVLDFLARVGAGDDFQRIVGELESEITLRISDIRNASSISSGVARLRDYLDRTLSPNPGTEQYTRSLYL